MDIYVCDFFFFVSFCVICVRFGWEMCLIKLWFGLVVCEVCEFIFILFIYFKFLFLV